MKVETRKSIKEQSLKRFARKSFRHSLYDAYYDVMMKNFRTPTGPRGALWVHPEAELTTQYRAANEEHKRWLHELQEVPFDKGAAKTKINPVTDDSIPAPVAAVIPAASEEIKETESEEKKRKLCHQIGPKSYDQAEKAMKEAAASGLIVNLSAKPDAKLGRYMYVGTRADLFKDMHLHGFTIESSNHVADKLISHFVQCRKSSFEDRRYSPISEEPPVAVSVEVETEEVQDKAAVAKLSGQIAALDSRLSSIEESLATQFDMISSLQDFSIDYTDEILQALKSVRTEIQNAAARTGTDMNDSGKEAGEVVLGTAHSQMKARVKEAYKPKILIISALPQQFHRIRQKFSSVFSLRNLDGSDSVTRIKECCKNSDVVLGMVGFMNHSTDEVLKNNSKDYRRVTGGVSSIMRELSKEALKIETA